MKKTAFAIVALLTFMLPHLSLARITCGPLVGNHMVLQQQSDVRLWGWTDRGAGTTITLRTSWRKGKLKVKSDAAGRWEFHIPTPKASFEPQIVTISDGHEKQILSDVLIGEVWLASGQSNMEMPLHGFANCPVENSAQHILESIRYKGRLHFSTVAFSPHPEEVDTVTAVWQDCVPQTARDFCAAGYFFGIRLTEALGCPVGVINSSLGATRVEGWTPRDNVATYPDENLTSDAYQGAHLVRPAYNVDRALPSVFYNGMIHPLEPYTIRGFLWYQAEANINSPQVYAERFVRMVGSWRQRWGLGDLPFYYVEICPYDYYWARDKATAALTREAQFQASEMLPRMGMVCTNDLVKDYEYWQIHPCMKKEVGDRLCLWALGDAYGIRGIDYRYPVYRSMEVEETQRGKQVRLTFDNAEDGFNRNVDIKGFEMCGPDSVWHEASVGISGSQVTVFCQKVPEPVAVRYAFKSFQPGNLKANSGLPVIPFRTDKFPR
ncbi:MAG: sialate O-acetylesterase [Bacteroidaceae bacterium]|nr:sialate O-acetylesterase [Bacteroidaceae bacterium]